MISRINGSSKKGINRVAWDLTKPLVSTINSNLKGRGNRGGSISVKPGLYTVQLFHKDKGDLTQLSEKREFSVKVIRENILDNPLEFQLEKYASDLNSFKAIIDLEVNSFGKSKQKLYVF